MITVETPATWQDLQSLVAGVLEQCGCKVEIEKKIATARGEVEVDVYAEEEVKGRQNVILCECKHWKARIPQNVIHGFRTVMGDVGANVGYIVGTSGFQSGAFNAADMTNVELVTWEEFQDQFEPAWLEYQFAPVITKQLDPIMTYTEPLMPRWIDQVPEEDAQLFFSLREKYVAFGWLMMSCTTYAQQMNPGKYPQLPLRESFKNKASKLKPEQIEWAMRGLPDALLDAQGYREFLEISLEYGIQGTAEFREIRDRNSLAAEECE